MTTPENEVRPGTGNQPDGDDSPKPKQEVTAGSIEALFQSITIKKLMEDETPGSASLNRLREIEENLESSDILLKNEASKQLQEVLATRDAIDAKAKKIEKVSDLLNIAKVDQVKKDKLAATASDIDSILAKEASASDEEIKRAHSELLEIAKGLGMKENAVGMEETMSRLHWIEAAKEARQFVKEREVYVNPVAEYEDEFKPEVEAKVLKLRDVDPGEKERLQRKLDGFKKHVSEELVVADPRKLAELSSDDLIKRLEEATYWQANMGDLQGRKKWQGTENLEQLRDMLGRVEAQYQALLESKMVKDITSKHGEEHLNKHHIRESVVKSLSNRRRFLRTEYDFDKGVPSGKRAAEVLEEEVYGRSKKMQAVETRRSPAPEHSRRVVTDEHGESYMPGKDDLNFEESAERTKRIKEYMEKAEEVSQKLGIDVNMAKTLRKSPALREQILKKAESTLSPSEMATFSHMYDHWEKTAMGGMRGELSPKQDELEALKGSRQYSKFIIKFKAYVERVGLREASSDWDFAIMMREAKEEISRIHPDAGEKLDQWQEALFAPGLTTLDEKSFFDVMPKMMTQSRLEHEFGADYANWEAMQVTGSDGTKRVISVASFYQLLQREDVAKRVLSAKTNGNDSVLQAVLVEHIWGPGAKLDTAPRVSTGQTPKMKVVFADGRTPIDDISVNYFSLQDNKFEEGLGEKLQIEDFIDQSMWMTHYAKTMWHYSGEWEPFLRDFPTDQLTQANKRLIAIGSAFRDYGLDYGKFDVGYAELAKAGVLLQPFSTYKIGDVIKTNIRHLLYDKGITNAKEGDKIGGAIMAAVQKKAFVSDKYKPVIGMRSVDEMRLMGRLSTGVTPADVNSREQLGWEMFKKNQEILGRKGVINLETAQALKVKYLRNEHLSEIDEAWAVQLVEIDTLMEDLASQRRKLGEAGFSEPILRQLMDKQSMLTTGEPYDGVVSLDEYLKRFEYSSVIDHAQLKKGTDPLDYKKYSEAKAEAAKLMTEVLSGSPTLENITQLYNTMKGYMPPEQLMDWFEEYMRTRVRLRTDQWVGYEIAMTDLEVWKMRKAKGEAVGDPPLGINPFTHKLKDERGDSWNVIGADGFKVTKKKMERGNHMWNTREIPGLTLKQIETEMKLYVGNRWLPNKEAGHRITENSMGLSQMIDRYYKNIGRPELSDKGLPKFVKKWGSKTILILRKHPLFDDPWWSFWSILNEYVEYSKEVSKEMQKSALGGH